MFKKIICLCFLSACWDIDLLAEELKTSVVWEKEYASTLPGGQELLMCTNSDVVFGRIPESGGLIIQRLTTKGMLVWEKLFKKVQHIAIDGKVNGIIEDLSGNIYMGVNTPNNGLLLLKISPSGQLLFSKNFYQDFYNNRGAYLSKLIIHAEAIYAFGQLGAHDVWLCKLTPEGSKILEISYNVGKDLMIVTGALVNRKGEVLVVLHSGQFDKFGGGPSLIKVLRFNEDSKKLELVTSFEGKKGSIGQLSGGGYAIAFNVSPVFPQQDIRLKLFNEDFEQQSEVLLYSNKIGASPIYLSPCENGSFLLAGIKNNKQVVIIINSKGGVIAEKIISFSDQVAFVSIIGAFVSGKKTFVSFYEYMDEDNVRQDFETGTQTKLVIYSRQ